MFGVCKANLMCNERVKLTYLYGHYNPIVGVLPALKLPSRRLCFAHVSSSWSHHSKSGPLQAGLSNGYAVVPLADSHQPLVINTLSNVHVIEELIQYMAHSYWTKNLAQHFSLENSQGSCIGNRLGNPCSQY